MPLVIGYRLYVYILGKFIPVFFGGVELSQYKLSLVSNKKSKDFFVSFSFFPQSLIFMCLGVIWTQIKDLILVPMKFYHVRLYSF